MNTIGDRIRYILENEEDNQKTKFSNKVGISRQSLGNYIDNISVPSATILISILAVYSNINPAWLICNEDPIYREEIRYKEKIISTNAILDDSRLLEFLHDLNERVKKLEGKKK